MTIQTTGFGWPPATLGAGDDLQRREDTMIRSSNMRQRRVARLATGCACVAGILFTACPNDYDTSPFNTDGASYGEDCFGPNDCVSPLVCSGEGICRYDEELGTADAGEACSGNEFCRYELVCSHDGVCTGEGGDGTTGVGDACESSEECQAMLDCVDGACHGHQVPLWWGTDCAEPDSGAVRVYFEVPGSEPPAEFYRLPFPNDARVIDGRISLDGHPSPGTLIEELGDLTTTMLETIEEDLGAFGNNQAVFMRFSADINYDTLVLDDPGDGTVYVVDITEGSDDYGERHSGGFRASGDRGLYICPNWIAFTNSDGRPYDPGHTYAAVVTTGVTAQTGAAPMAQDADFTAVVADSAPDDERLEHAWEAYAPFRAWLADTGIDPSAIAGAAVFTVQDPPQHLRDLREAVHGADTPTLDGVILCQSGDPGPYTDPEDETRGCTDIAPAYYEVQGTVALPRFQEGTPPFKLAAHGGGLADEPVATDEVVFSLTIPSGATMPNDGWPLVLFAHGTGGNYRSFVTDGVADVLTSIDLDDGSRAHFAVLSIDAVDHGPRRFPDNWDASWLDIDPAAYDPGVLFFNVLNPRAARDNSLQAAADYFGLTWLVEELAWDADASPTGQDVRFDPDHLYYMGHSQGSNTGVGFVANEPLLQGAVFSGAGGLLIESMLNKDNPYDFPAALEIALADPDIDRWHPVLNLFQALVERGDGVNHAAQLLRYPYEDESGHHVLQTYGIDDTFEPEQTQYALARALRVDQLTNGNPALQNISIENPPLSANFYIGSKVYTGAVALYAPNGASDGHDVIYDLDSAQRQYSHFFGTDLTGLAPTVVAP